MWDVSSTAMGKCACSPSWWFGSTALLPIYSEVSLSVSRRQIPPFFKLPSSLTEKFLPQISVLLLQDFFFSTRYSVLIWLTLLSAGRSLIES